MRFINKNVLVMGVAKSGYSAVSALTELGANAFIFDSDFNRTQAVIKYKLVQESVVAVKKITKKLLKGIDFVVVSPGVPASSRHIKFAKKMGLDVIGELELGYKMIKCPLYAITGTNGKTTTTELLGAIFKKASYTTHVVGNVGIPITSVALDAHKSDIGVVEVSSYQLETIADFHAFGVGVTNIQPDHLDRHGGMQNYIDTKLNIFKNATKTDFAMLNADDEVVAGFSNKLNCRKYFFSLVKPVQGIYVKDCMVVFCEGKKVTPLFKAESLHIKGSHNLANALLAAGMAFLAGITPAVISSAIAEFSGVAHRLEFVRNINGIDYFNDSKATNPNSTLVAVNAFTKPIILLLGGSDKGSDFHEMFRAMPKNVRAALVYGATKKKILKAAEEEGFLAVEEAADLEFALFRAAAIAKPNEVVLLSPACASFDAFNNFEHRGEAFRELVEELN